ncbi:MAG: TIGR02444 family protein [Alphaproteobacteria bacterium]|nr:TIGR02444 family protein [Alphaproteobacteria bacterium]
MTQDSLPDSDTFRQFCLTLYAAEGVEAACLDLQDKFGLDVTLILLCCWVGQHGVRLSTESLAQAEQSVKPWRETAIDPIRALRRRLKDAVGPIDPDRAKAVRDLIKQAELAAEFVQMDHLVILLEHLPGRDARMADRAGIVRGNLLRYTAAKSIKTDLLPRPALETLIAQTIAPLYDEEDEEQGTEESGTELPKT